jgi:hypothetical protein
MKTPKGKSMFASAQSRQFERTQFKVSLGADVELMAFAEETHTLDWECVCYHSDPLRSIEKTQ